MAVNIQPYLDIIQNASNGEDVRDAIVNCMSEINKDSAFDVTNKTIRAKLSNINKTYSAPSKQVWKQVTLEIEDDSGQTINTGNQTKYDFEVDNYTEPRTYNAVEEHGENAVWGDIIVNTDFSGNWDGIVDNVIISTSDLDETSTYSASTRGKTAFRSVTFSDVDPIKDGGGYYGPNGEGYFNITFDANGGQWSDGSKKKQMSIQAGNLVECDPHPTKVGFDFMGWDSNYGGSGLAKRSETVYAHWGNASVLVGEITDDWNVIAECRGTNYHVGQYKYLKVDVEIPYSADLAVFPDLPSLVNPASYNNFEGTYRYYAEWLFMKVASGEGGSKSSWMTMLPAYLHQAPIPQHILDYSNDYSRIDPRYNRSDYGSAKTMAWLNTVFIDHCLPEWKSFIVPITKHYHATSEAGTNTNLTSNRRIWIPSTKEMFIKGFDDQPEYSDMPSDPDLLAQATSILVDNAIGQSYMEANLALTDGSQRRRLFELMISTWPAAESNMTRDMGIGSNREDLVYMPCGHDFTIEGETVQSSWIQGLNVSRAKSIEPKIIGFCF